MNFMLVVFPGTSVGQVANPPTDPVPPAGEVNIFRDIYGVPHVYAANAAEGLFGVGYALAGDNLENILFRYVAVNGKLAEVFGSQYVMNDLFVRRFKVVSEGQAAYDAFPDSLKISYTHFFNGIKQYMADNPNKVPGWWASQVDLVPSQITITAHWASLLLNSITAYGDCAAGGISPQYPLRVDDLALNKTLLDPDDVSYGSNVMVLMGSKTQNNEVFFSTDNHSNASSERNEIRIHAAELQVMGMVGAGQALPFIGHTDNLAWGVTMGGPDTGDCYSFDIDPADSNQYLYDGQSIPFVVEYTVIAVKDEPSQTYILEYVKKNNLKIPVVQKANNKAYAAAAAYQGKAGVSDMVLALINQVNNIGDFKTAISSGGYGPYNIMAADTQGDSFYIRNGLVPRRLDTLDWNNIVDGSNVNSNWKEVNGSPYHPSADLVQVSNPAAGYMHNNNVSADKMLHDQDLPVELQPAGYPVYIFNGVNKTHARGKRAIEVLRPMTSATLADFGALVMDEKWISASKWTQALSNAIAGTANWSSKPQDVQDVATRIMNFDGFAAHGSVAALNYVIWLDEISRSSADPEDIINAVMAGQALSAAQNADLIASLETAVATMNTAWATTDVSLGHMFKVGRGTVREPLGGVTSIIGGLWREQTLRAFEFATSPNNPLEADMTKGQRNPMLMILANGQIYSGTSVPYGQNGDPSSAHYSDQSQFFRDKELKPTFFNYSDLKNNLESFVTITVTTP